MDNVDEDSFQDNIKNYLEITGQTEEGIYVGSNVETSGRYHTDWLNMIYPRLKIAKNLLTEDGVIFISIDENEDYNLREMCDEVFGEEDDEDDEMGFEEVIQVINRWHYQSLVLWILYAKVLISVPDFESISFSTDDTPSQRRRHGQAIARYQVTNNNVVNPAKQYRVQVIGNIELCDLTNKASAKIMDDFSALKNTLNVNGWCGDIS